MRIVQLNPYHYPYMGGIEHRVHEVSKRLSSKHEMIVVTGRLPGTEAEEERDGYRIIRLPSRLLDIYNPPFISTPGVLDALEKLEPDVVDFHYRWAPSYTKAMNRYGGKWTFTFHNTFGEGHGLNRAMSLINDAMFCRRIREQRVICITEFIKGDLLKRGFSQDRLEVIPPGIDLAEDEGTEGDYILFIGRLVGTKGIPHLIRAMGSVNGKLIIVGEGPERRHLEAVVRSAGVEEKVVLTGRVSENEKIRLLSGCKVFAMPSLFESYGLAVAEAMSWGKPVVASRVGGLPEVVGDGGILCPPRDVEAISAALSNLLEDDAGRRACARRAKVHIQRFAWTNVVRDIEAAYCKVAEE